MILGVGSTPFCRSFCFNLSTFIDGDGEGKRGGPVEASMEMEG